LREERRRTEHLLFISNLFKPESRQSADEEVKSIRQRMVQRFSKEEERYERTKN